MNNMFRFVLLSSALALIGVSGCDSDAGAEKVGNPCTDECNPDEKRCDGDELYICGKNEDSDDACYEWILKETCSDGKHCDAKKLKCAAGCSEICDENSTMRCSSKGLEECVPDKKGCASWSVVDPCEGGKCDPDTLECVDGDCPNACDPDKDLKKCDGEDLYACQKNEDAEEECYTWVLEKACGNGSHCDETTLDCSSGCTEICEEERLIRCSADGLEQCSPDENGCASWSVIDACAGGSCDQETLKCTNACDNQCADGEKKCDDNGIAECTIDEDGCLKWGETTACGENKTCDPQTVECVDVCNSNCTEKDKTENFAASQKVCTDVDGKGCLQWVETKCNKGEKFDAGQNKCVSVCGNDCGKFRIVFIPDSQEYTRKIKKSGSNFVKTDGSVNIFPDQLQWIKDNKDKYNIKAVIHLGDLTDTNSKIAWQLTSNSYAKYIDVMDLPYTVAPGNHDFKQCNNNNNAAVDYDKKQCVGKNNSTYSRSATQFHKTDAGNFNQSRAKVKDRKWFAEYKNDKEAKVGNSFITFKAANIDFLVIALEYLPRKSVIEWADKVISNHPNHKVILESHSYLNPGGNTHCTAVPKMNGEGQFTNSFSGVDSDAKRGFNNDANGGEKMFNDLVSRHNNIILFVNGHHSGSCFRLNKGKNGNTVAEMVVDYQTEDGIGGKCGHTHDHGGGGTGWFRMLEFDPQNYTITSITATSLGGKRFKKGKPWFYCKNLYPQDPTKKPGYKIDMDSDAHRFTNHHAFVANFDFVTPVDYNKK